MSIYASLWELKFPAAGDWHVGAEWVSVRGQAVPGHVGSPTPGHGYEKGDPYADFLPPAIEVDVDDESPPNRAVVIVRVGTPKVVQRYTDPLLVLSGQEYAEATFDSFCERICDALRGDRPRLMLQALGPEGGRLMFEDGSSRLLSREELLSEGASANDRDDGERDDGS